MEKIIIHDLIVNCIGKSNVYYYTGIRPCMWRGLVTTKKNVNWIWNI